MSNLKPFTTEELQEELERRKQIEEEGIPEPLDLINWQAVLNLCKSYIETLAKEEYEIKDIKSFIFEEALQAVYGKDIWPFIRERMG